MRMIFTIMIGLCSTTLFAQSWQNITAEEVDAIYGKMQKAYDKENYKVVYEELFYLNENDMDSVYQQKKGVLYRGAGHNYAYYTPSEKVIQEGDLKIVIMEETKSVYINERDSVFELFRNQKLAKNSDSFICSKMTDGDETLIQVHSKNASEIRQSVVYIAKDYQLNKMVLHYSPSNYAMNSMWDETVESPVMIVSYENMEQLTDSDKRLLRLDTYLTGNEKKYELSADLVRKGFQLVDLRYKQTTSSK